MLRKLGPTYLDVVPQLYFDRVRYQRHVERQLELAIPNWIRVVVHAFRLYTSMIAIHISQ